MNRSWLQMFRLIVCSAVFYMFALSAIIAGFGHSHADTSSPITILLILMIAIGAGVFYGMFKRK
jgi:hypothetical protein